jgi:oligoribonuclease
MSLKRGWIDLETSGFTELYIKAVYDHRILEFGCAVTDEDLNVIDTLDIVVHNRFDEYKHVVDDVVLNMHTKNGLFAECEASNISLKQAEAMVIAFFHSHGINAKDTPLSGNGITHDRIFIEAHLPELSKFLHYRQLDISSVKEFLKIVLPGNEPPKKATHRGLEDILESIAEAQHYRDIIQNLAGKS